MCRTLPLWFLTLFTASLQAGEPFVVRVVDDVTGRGVPLVELQTVHHQRFYTDNAGLIAITDEGLMGEEVYFFVESHGYEFARDGFGNRGVRLKLKPGRSAELKIRRQNIAERLYRITGAALYQHTLRAGKQAPIEQPRLNAEVVGCDSAQTAVYRGKLFWIWGDTSWLSYPLGNFHSTAATSRLPGHGGLDPAIGINFKLFENGKGFVRGIAPLPGEGPTWLTALVCLKDAEGNEHLVAAYNKIKPPLTVYERGLCEFDSKSEQFEKRFAFDRDQKPVPSGHAFRHKVGERRWLYFGEATPEMRVADRYESLTDPDQYEPVKADAVFTDAANNKPVKAHHGSVAWNDYRKRWVSIFTQQGGQPSYLGEIYYAEAEAPEGPWRKAVKIASHDRYSFYNPKQHPYFSAGKYLYFEGTYTVTFSGNDNPTPLYDYNQIMYRLDLSDARLNDAQAH
jgi:hypothetical protein